MRSLGGKVVSYDSSRGWRGVVMTPRAVSETLPSPTEEAATLITA